MTHKDNEQNATPKKSLHPFEEWNTLRVIKWVLIAFPVLIFYIYNSLHTAKALKKRNELNKTLKELHSERISLESEITQASKQSKIAEQLEHKGLKELSKPPKKIIRDNK
jgi:cell division protein FtsL